MVRLVKQAERIVVLRRAETNVSPPQNKREMKVSVWHRLNVIQVGECTRRSTRGRSTERNKGDKEKGERRGRDGSLYEVYTLIRRAHKHRHDAVIQSEIHEVPTMAACPGRNSHLSG